ncbi:MAG: malto-oligosyltrehalose synthase [Alphaproteobacteria bacterium]
MSLPTATYRLQFRQGMNFDRAASLAPYFSRLGVSHLYASPLFQATPGSTHGYDVTDHNRFDESLGGLDGFLRLAAALKAEGLGLILDIVPNHMAASVHNPWWRDLLRNGRASRYAQHFDVDWSMPRVLLAVLEASFQSVLEDGVFSIECETDGPCWDYRGTRFPIAPESWHLLAQALPKGTDPGVMSPDRLPAWLSDLSNKQRLDEALRALSSDRAFLERLHDAQHWRLAYWRAGRDMLNYRRFFEISELVGVRVEDESVFADVHRLLFEMLEAGHIDGLRIDHVDGLSNPSGYLHRLKETAPGNPPVWVEKILGDNEALADDWPVAGTTGYEFAVLVGDLLMNSDGIDTVTDGYRAFTGSSTNVAAMLAEAKHEILTRNLAGELMLLQRLLVRMAALDPQARDWGPDTLRRALIAIAVSMPVYRTYLAPTALSPEDDAVLALVARKAVQIYDLEDPHVVSDVLRLFVEAKGDDAHYFRQRFQQTTGALMAKAMEDTLFYRSSRLLSANEVGGTPALIGSDEAVFADAIAARARRQPAGLNATATHDTKRGEDARMRIAAIADYPEAWVRAVKEWDVLLASEIDEVPDPEMRWHFYQALLGVWTTGDLDDLRERLSSYMLKAAREAKRNTSWARIDDGYESRLGEFVAQALSADSPFPERFSAAAARFIAVGERKSLVQLALKLTLPGIPDIYQGTERADLSLVDPDNRRPVDFPAHDSALASEPTPGGDFEQSKLALLLRLLRLRKSWPQLFAEGSFLPLDQPMAQQAGFFAFVRDFAGQGLLVMCDCAAAEAETDGQARFTLPESWKSMTLRSVYPDAGVVRTGNTVFSFDAFRESPVIVMQAESMD